MRKLTIVLLALCLVIGLAACSGSKAAEEPEQPVSSAEEQTESPEDEADGDDAGEASVCRNLQMSSSSWQSSSSIRSCL